MSAVEHVATAPVAEWQPMESAPFASKCLLLTIHGIAVIGIASLMTSRDGTPAYLAWAPLPQRPPWLVELAQKWDPYTVHKETQRAKAA